MDGRIARMELGLVALAAIAISQSGASPVKFPVKLDRPGYLQGIWDVGPAYVAGQPSEDALRSLAKEGVKTVVCIRGTGEMNDRSVVSFDEAALLRELGITYYHFPMGTAEEYNPTVVSRFAEVMAKADGRVLLHCTVAWRASYVWTAYLHTVEKMPLDEAIKNGGAMNLSANRIGAALGAEFTYSSKPRTEGSRRPTSGTVSKSGAKLIVHEPRVVNAPSEEDFNAFALWDMGSILNSSQPDEKKLRELAAQGVKTVINIRTDAEMARIKDGGFDEEALARELGLEYIKVPIQALADFNPQNLEKLAKAIDGAKGKVLLHCTTATRTSNLWAAYLTRYQGVPLDEAIKHAGVMRFTDILGDVLGMDIIYKIKPGTGQNPCGGGL